jgi:hypothetical protein
MTRVQLLAGAMMELFLFATTSRLALEPTQPPIQWVLADLGVFMVWCLIKHRIHIYGMYLAKHRNKFTLEKSTKLLFHAVTDFMACSSFMS